MPGDDSDAMPLFPAKSTIFKALITAGRACFHNVKQTILDFQLNNKLYVICIACNCRLNEGFTEFTT